MNKKFFDNEKAVEGGVVGILVLLIISLVFTACFTSWILFNAYGVQVSGIVLPSTTGQTNQNFLTGDTFPSNMIQKTGCWTLVNNVGAVASLDNSLMLFDGVSSNNGVYYNKYRLDNSIKKDYSVILEWTENTYIKVKVTEEGFYYVAVNSLAWFGKSAEKFYPYDNANQITDVTIETEYYPIGFLKDGLIFKINGVTAFRIPWSELIGTHAGIIDKKYYGGVVAENSGLIIKTFESINDRTTDGWEGFLGNGVAFIRTLFLITVWNISPAYLPWEINLIFIKTQVFGIIACAVAYIRG